MVNNFVKHLVKKTTNQAPYMTIDLDPRWFKEPDGYLQQACIYLPIRLKKLQIIARADTNSSEETQIIQIARTDPNKAEETANNRPIICKMGSDPQQLCASALLFGVDIWYNMRTHDQDVSA